MPLQRCKVLVTRLLHNPKARPMVVSGYHPIQGKYCFMNGFEAVFLNQNYGYPVAQSPMNEKTLADLMYSQLPRYTESITDCTKWSGIDATRIDLNDLESFIEAHGGRRKIDPTTCYQVNNGWYYDPLLLYDMAHLIPRNEVYASGKATAFSLKKDFPWLWFYNGEGEAGVLLPKNPIKKKE